MNKFLNFIWTNRFERLIEGAIIDDVHTELHDLGIKFEYKIIDIRDGEPFYVLTVYCRGDQRPFITIVDKMLHELRAKQKKYREDVDS